MVAGEWEGGRKEDRSIDMEVKLTLVESND